MRFGSLFAGIGGIDFGLERAGMECAWQVEIDEFCQKVLNKHWPEVLKYRDIRNVGEENLETVDLIAGGFPCQPFSVAGKRRGMEDNRHLWPEMLRVISELQPAWVLGENVPGIIPLFLDQAISDLEAEGYTAKPFVLPACAFDAPHRRDRLFIIAYDESNLRRTSRNEGPISPDRGSALMADTNYTRSQRHGQLRKRTGKRITGQSGGETSRQSARWLPEPNVGRVADGVPDRVDRLKSLGNAVVPQVAEFIGRVIREAKRLEK